MQAAIDSIATQTGEWLVRFEQTLGAPGGAGLEALFHPACYWRDALALTWQLHTVGGREAVTADLKKYVVNARPMGFRLSPRRTPPRRVKRAGRESIEAIFGFETAQGRASGVLRLIPDAADGNTLKAWTLFTSLDELKGFEEHTGRARPKGESYSRDFRGPNWLDLRRTANRYEGRDPEVLVIGGGQAGLDAAACLSQLGVDTLIVDRERHIGDNWRKRYHALTLHNQVQVNHMPYMPFPPNWPSYIPKDKLAGWFEAYVEAMELNYWTGTEFQGGTYDEAAGRWTAKLRVNDGGERVLHPRHIVMATGVSGIPNRPDIASLAAFSGPVLHSSQYRDGEDWKGKKVLIIGTGNSAHDIGQDLYSSGAQVTLVQRNSTLVTNIEPSAQLAYALYDEGPPLADCDLIAASMPLALAKKTHQMLTEQAKVLDRALLDGLERVGFKLDFGEDGTGWQFKYLSRGGGYYFNVGASDLVVKGEIGLRQFADIERFVPEGVRMRDGSLLPADLIVLATGYKGQEALVERLFGAAVAQKIGPIWGFGDGQELRNMFSHTAQPGLWFIAGSLAQCRIYSKVLALQIKAIEAGLLPRLAAPG